MDIAEYIGINVVFEGQLIDRSNFDESSIEYLFIVENGIMNSINGDTLKVVTSRSELSCGLSCGINEDWIIYAYIHNGLLKTNICTRSKKLKFSLNPWTSLKRHKRFINKYIGFNGVVKDKSARGKLTNGKPTGLWEIYGADHLFQLENYSEEGKLHGLCQQFNSTGTRFEKFYQNGVFMWYKHYNKQEELIREKIIKAPNKK